METIATEIIQKHAEEFNVSELDAEMFIKSVALSFENVLDRCKININSYSEDVVMSFFEIALDDSTEKMIEFVNQYNSYKHKREAFHEHVLNIL